MDPITIVESVMRRWWLPVLFALAGIACAYELASTAPKRYQSTVSLQLNPAASSPFLPYQSDAAVSSTSPVVVQAASYQEVLRSRTFDSVVVQQLNLPLPPEALAGAISTQLVPNTNILHLSVTWDNPSDAQQLAQRTAEIFIAENQRRQQAQPGVQAQLADMEQSARDMQARRGPLQQQRDRLDEAVARGDLSRLNDLTALEARLSALDTSYANLLVETSRIRGSFDTAVVLDAATPARALDALPLSQALVFGLLGGAAVAVVLCLLLERLADVVRGPSEVVAATGLPLLGRLRHVRRWRWPAGGRRGPLVALDARGGSMTEAFRSLRTAVLLSGLTPGPPHALLVTGAERGAGATFVAANLAIVLAQAGQRVLLVDGNLRAPTLHRLFNVPNTDGFAAVLRRAQSELSLSHAGTPEVVASSVPNLAVLPAGQSPADVGELLTAAGVARAFEHLGRAWDTVLVDSADMGRVADSLVLAHEASACIVVARAARTSRGDLSSAAAALDGVAAQVIGVVLNDERPGPLARFGRAGQFRPIYAATAPDLDHEPSPGRLPRSLAHPTPPSDAWRE